MKPQIISEWGNRRNGSPQRSIAAQSCSLLAASIVIVCVVACRGGLQPVEPTGTAGVDYAILDSKGIVKQDLSAAFAYIMNSEYDVNWSQERSAYGSPNRKQRLTFTYLPNGFTAERFKAGNAAAEDWKVTLRLKSLGNGSVVTPDPSAKIAVNGHAIRFATSDVAYDYLNDQAGMRQNFTVEHRPRSGNLALELAADLNGVEMRVDKGGSFAYFITAPTKREVMRYTSLKVWDADGRVLPAQMKLLAPDRLAIVVDHRTARYPVTVDPLNLDTGVVGPQAGEKFGFSVAAGGSTLDSNNTYGFIVVGAPDFAVGTSHNVGKVFVFAGGASGAINTPAYWTAVGSQANQLFGWSVAVSYGSATLNDDGTPDVVVGAPGYNLGGVFVWYGNSANNPIFGSTADWTRYGPSAGDYEFGFSVAVVNGILTDGRAQYLDTLVVGDPYFTWAQGQYTNTYAGAAYAYYGRSGGLNSTADWSQKGAASSYNFGYSVAGIKYVKDSGGTQNLYGDVFVGAPGANYVYVYTGTGTILNTSAALVANNGSTGGSFGWSVTGLPKIDTSANSGFAVGAPGVNSNKGRVYVYNSLASASAFETLDPDSSANTGSKFGYSLAGGQVDTDSYGDLIVGAPYENLGSNAAVGWVYVFYGDGSSPLGTTPETQQDATANADLGYSVAFMPYLSIGTSTTGVLAGAPNDPGIGGSQNYGAVYEFYH